MTVSTRGAFVVLEGCDRAGKSTQCQKLVENLEASGIPAKYIKFPDRTTKIGNAINDYLTQKSDLDDHVIHLMFSANRWEAMKALRELLQKGYTLIVDRYAYSGVVFSVAKGLDEAWCKGCDTGLILPDRVFFMDLPPEEISKRGGFGEERYERLEFQMKARELFHKLIKNDASGKWKMVDANRDVSCIADDLLNETKQVISAVSESDIQEKLFA